MFWAHVGTTPTIADGRGESPGGDRHIGRHRPSLVDVCGLNIKANHEGLKQGRWQHGGRRVSEKGQRGQRGREYEDVEEDRKKKGKRGEGEEGVIGCVVSP